MKRCETCPEMISDRGEALGWRFCLKCRPRGHPPTLRGKAALEPRPDPPGARALYTSLTWVVCRCGSSMVICEPCHRYMHTRSEWWYPVLCPRCRPHHEQEEQHLRALRGPQPSPAALAVAAAALLTHRIGPLGGRSSGRDDHGRVRIRLALLDVTGEQAKGNQTRQLVVEGRVTEIAAAIALLFDEAGSHDTLTCSTGTDGGGGGGGGGCSPRMT